MTGSTGGGEIPARGVSVARRRLEMTTARTCPSRDVSSFLIIGARLMLLINSSAEAAHDVDGILTDRNR
jgi:hypothetical protein